LANGDVAIAILNRSSATQDASFDFKDLGLDGKYEIRDLWQHKIIGKKEKNWKGKVLSHETKLFRLKKMSSK
jgi:alpha-galactosidase